MTDSLADRLLNGDRAALAKAITRVESTRKDHQDEAVRILDAVMPYTGKADRIGLTGVPGVGKSTMIDALGMHLRSLEKRVAVLAVDPSSSRTHGSILGDKTRMARLATDRGAFIRPSPSAGTLGGVARATRESLLLCEAAGFDVVIVETVGVGQSETVVAEMTDVFVALMLPGAGDQLQGIKKGILELIDIAFINKADGDNVTRARRSAKDLKSALHMFEPVSANWTVPVLIGSALEGIGIPELWQAICDHRETLESSGERSERRAAQQVRWFHALLDEGLRDAFMARPGVAAAITTAENAVSAGRKAPRLAAQELIRKAGF